jgi:hypothetical protein
MHWLQDPNHGNVNILNNVRHSASRHYRKKEGEYLSAKICELEIDSMINNIRDVYRGIIDFKKGYQPRTNIVKDQKGDLVTDCHRILARWRYNFSQLFNVHGVNDVRQMEIHTAAPLVSNPSAPEVEMATKKLKRHKSLGIDKILGEFIKAGGRKIRSEVHKHTSSIWNKKELLEEWKESIVVPIYRKGDKKECSNCRGISLLSSTYKIFSNILLSSVTPYAEENIGQQQGGFRRNGSNT